MGKNAKPEIPTTQTEIFPRLLSPKNLLQVSGCKQTLEGYNVKWGSWPLCIVQFHHFSILCQGFDNRSSLIFSQFNTHITRPSKPCARRSLFHFAAKHLGPPAFPPPPLPRPSPHACAQTLGRRLPGVQRSGPGQRAERDCVRRGFGRFLIRSLTLIRATQDTVGGKCAGRGRNCILGWDATCKASEETPSKLKAK